ncbi:hypothetical protein ACFSC6_21830 [Rufibacter sediminis]|uniref:Glycosyltransferase RgtA/B/C/D-like domain-containing protein n=1 Tax=Rufibacter sediminis TaxID=2762756 RepID=A0ABR6VV23_9BACT|nr:hypothetical protein [Rufibacter sediminis]MBC3540780.1 hypothetical protein [Rufibacter sediminis]
MNKSTGVKALLVLGWLLLQMMLYQHHGVRIVYDSHRFILFTSEILADQPVTYPQVWRYLGYPLLLFPFFKAGLALSYVVWAQMAVSGVAAIALYKAAKQITGKEGLALLTVSLFAFNPDLQAWNCYILTDSLFTSLLTITLSLALLPKTRLLWIGFVLAISWTTLARPNGFIILLALTAYFVVLYKPFSKFNKWAIGLTTMLLLLGLYLALDKFMLKAFTLMIPYERGDLIYGYFEFVLTDFHQPQIPSSSLTPLGQVLWFIWVNPIYFLAMALLKGLFFLIHVKPFYSLAHNLAILAYLLPIYAFAWIGWKRGQLSASNKALLLTPVLLQVGITMLTIEDWDGRWLYPALPCFLLLAGAGISSRLSPSPKLPNLAR